MIQVENKQWNSVEHSVFDTRYAALLIMHGIAGEEIGPSQELLLASYLTDSPETGIQSATVGVNEWNGYLEFTTVIEGDDEVTILRRLTGNVLRSLAAIKRNPDHFEFRDAHVAYEEQLKLDKAIIQDPRYALDESQLFEVSEDGLEQPTDARKIFIETQQAL